MFMSQSALHASTLPSDSSSHCPPHPRRYLSLPPPTICATSSSQRLRRWQDRTPGYPEEQEDPPSSPSPMTCVRFISWFCDLSLRPLQNFGGFELYHKVKNAVKKNFLSKAEVLHGPRVSTSRGSPRTERRGPTRLVQRPATVATNETPKSPKSKAN